MKYNDRKTLIYVLDALLILVFFVILYSNNNGNTLSSQPSNSESKRGLTQLFSLNNNSLDYRQEMRDWVIEISEISKSTTPNFLIIPQNCTELLTSDGVTGSELQHDFLDAIDGIGQEGLSYGYGRFNAQTKDSTKNILSDMLKIASANGIKVIALDYCKQDEKIDLARDFNDTHEFIGFQAQHLELADIPSSIPYNSNNDDITSLNKAKNCLFLLNPQEFDTSDDLIKALSQTDYDVLIIDSFFDDNEMLLKTQVNELKTKSNGAKRLVISYLSIGEAEDYRYYYDSSFDTSPPAWLLDENSNWQGNYIVEYWNDEWQKIIATGNDSYLKRIIDADFDGVYLDIVDGYQNFE